VRPSNTIVFPFRSREERSLVVSEKLYSLQDSPESSAKDFKASVAGAELSELELAQISAGGSKGGGGSRTSVVNRINIVNRNNVRVNIRRH
jgi:hypothetical protein